jgi:hypothetical protein
MIGQEAAQLLCVEYLATKDVDGGIINNVHNFSYSI